MTRGADGIAPPGRATQGLRARAAPAPGAPRVLTAALLLALASAGANAQTSYGVPASQAQPLPPDAPGAAPRRLVVFEPTLGVEETLTSNANFDRGNSQREGDVVTTITPGFRVNAQGARASLTGGVILPIFLYARTGADNNRVLPQANLDGHLEAWERFFFVDGSINVTQQYLSPFGARPSSGANNSDNQYTAYSYRISPYVKGEFRSHVQYELRDTSIWTRLTQSSTALDNAYTNQIVGRLDQEPTPFGWGGDFLRSSVDFAGQQQFVTELARLRGSYKVDPQLELDVSGGYENNDYAFVKYTGTIYGFGAKWRPGERTSLDARWEHRFFGSSYNVAFDHRTALTVWNVRVSRDITSYPEQVASLAAGTNVASLIDSLFALRVPDPVLRQQLVDQFIRDRGLPLFVNDALQLYTQQISLVQSVRASAGILGVRNTLFFNAFYNKNESITAAGNVSPDPSSGLTNNTQTGGSIVWTHNLSPLLILTSTLDYLHTKALPPQSVRTDQGALTVVLSRPITPLTSIHAGARYQSLRSDIRTDYEEAAIFVGFDHRFR